VPARFPTHRRVGRRAYSQPSICSNALVVANKVGDTIAEIIQQRISDNLKRIGMSGYKLRKNNIEQVAFFWLQAASLACSY
jgi:hypothetical protein